MRYNHHIVMKEISKFEATQRTSSSMRTSDQQYEILEWIYYFTSIYQFMESVNIRPRIPFLVSKAKQTNWLLLF